MIGVSYASPFNVAATFNTAVDPWGSELEPMSDVNVNSRSALAPNGIDLVTDFASAFEIVILLHQHP